MDFKLHFPVSKATAWDYLLEKDVVSIGRMEGNDLVLTDNLVSKKHARLLCSDGLFEIEDLGSRNGVYINGRKITGKSSLHPGDLIQLGNTKFFILPREDGAADKTVILRSLGPEKEPDLDQKRLKVIYDVATELTGNQDIAGLSEKVISLFRDIFHHDRCYLALFDKEGALQPVCSDPQGEPVPLSKSIAKRLFQNGESFLLEDALSDTALKEQESVLSLKIRSAMCVPLIYHSHIYGLIYLDRSVAGAFAQDDLEFLRSAGALLAPLIENARLWSELKSRYDDTVKALRETEATLIEAERTAAYVRLAHAMAHEIRNPLMVAGGLVRKLSRTEGIKGDTLESIIHSIERVESVLREVDSFVKIPLPHKTLQRIDLLVQEEIDNHGEEWKNKGIGPQFSIMTSHLMIPVDGGLMRKAVSMVCRELLFCAPRGKEFPVVMRDSGSNVEIDFGEVDTRKALCRPFDPEIRDKPWGLSLFLNIAHKILSDHGGRILLDPAATSAYPIIMQIPR